MLQTQTYTLRFVFKRVHYTSYSDTSNTLHTQVYKQESPTIMSHTLHNPQQHKHDNKIETQTPQLNTTPTSQIKFFPAQGLPPPQHHKELMNNVTRLTTPQDQRFSI